MRVVAGVLTWNTIENDRVDSLLNTATSLVDAGADQITIFDNGSHTKPWTDELENSLIENVGLVRFPKVPGFPHGNTCGYGMNKMAATLRDQGDIVVLSNDDIEWSPNAVDVLREVWEVAPYNLTILSGLVEPTFSLPNQEPWNQPYGAATVSGHRILVRKSVPGGAWTFLNSNIDKIFPVSTFPGIDDVPACHRLQAEGLGVACVDIATHQGIGQSTWGNASHERFQVTSLEDVKAEYDL